MIQIACMCSFVEMVVMSGDEARWLAAGGMRVGVLWLRMMWSELLMMSDIRLPL